MCLHIRILSHLCGRDALFDTVEEIGPAGANVRAEDVGPVRVDNRKGDVRLEPGSTSG